MLNVAIVGLGRWGQRLVDSIAERGSGKLRFTHAVTRTPEKVRAYCEARQIALTRICCLVGQAAAYVTEQTGPRTLYENLRRLGR